MRGSCLLPFLHDHLVFFFTFLFGHFFSTVSLWPFNFFLLFFLLLILGTREGRFGVLRHASRPRPTRALTHTQLSILLFLLHFFFLVIVCVCLMVGRGRRALRAVVFGDGGGDGDDCARMREREYA